MTDLAPATPALDRPQGDVPRPEYPRPDRDRSDRWLNLNGTWSLDTPAGSTSITVPFAWETLASGVARTWLEHATYRRTVTVPAGWAGARVVLCFGAVHHRARVLVDGFEVGTHVGGYDPFEPGPHGRRRAWYRVDARGRGRGPGRQARDTSRQAALHPARRLRRCLLPADVRHLADGLARGPRPHVRRRGPAARRVPGRLRPERDAPG